MVKREGRAEEERSWYGKSRIPLMFWFPRAASVSTKCVDDPRLRVHLGKSKERLIILKLNVSGTVLQIGSFAPRQLLSLGVASRNCKGHADFPRQ